MKIGILGYGKMGKAVETAALAKGHQIVARIDSHNNHDFKNLHQADVIIEFTNPGAVVANLRSCLDLKIPVVTGTTGWNEHISAVESEFIQKGGALIHASNFSIGVNLFMEVNRVLAALMNHQPQYEVMMSETHHTQKLDSPSGTAISLANEIIKHLDRKSNWVNQKPNATTELEIESLRLPDVPGTHLIRYSSAADEIEITHTAKNRTGFATGAVLAAEWLIGKTGIFTMKDVLNIKSS
jgi:4-hydroxy-tetrahydrodipicolinate reductase